MEDEVGQVVHPIAIESRAIESRAEALRIALNAVDEAVGAFGVLFVIEEAGPDGKVRQRVTRDRGEAVKAAAAGRLVHTQLAAPALSRLAYLAGIAMDDGEIHEEISKVGDYLVVTRWCDGFRLTIWMDGNLAVKRVDAAIRIAAPTGTFIGHGSTSASERNFSNDHAAIATAITRAWSNAVAQALGGRNRPARFDEEELIVSQVRTPADLVVLARRYGVDERAILDAAGVSRIADIPPAAVRELALRILRGEINRKGGDGNGDQQGVQG